MFGWGLVTEKLMSVNKSRPRASLVIDNNYTINYIWPGELVRPYPGRLLALAGVGLPHGLESALDQLGGAQR